MRMIIFFTILFSLSISASFAENPRSNDVLHTIPGARTHENTTDHSLTTQLENKKPIKKTKKSLSKAKRAVKHISKRTLHKQPKIKRVVHLKHKKYSHRHYSS